MNLLEAQKKLTLARQRAKDLPAEIAQLRQAIIADGGNPSPVKVDHVMRNKQIYRARQDGQKLTEIANEFKMSPGRISEICGKIDRILEAQKWHFHQYKDLLRYKIEGPLRSE